MMTSKEHIELFKEVKRCLLYYANFKHPLKLQEIHSNMQLNCKIADLKMIVDKLLNKNEIFYSEEYYTVSQDIENWISRRIKGENQAKKVFPSAKAYGKFIFLFPFVRFVGISGSLSKGYYGRYSDFDFFIVSANKRLWICRSILHLFKKLSFLFGMQHRFCMNYFVDEKHREIEEKNFYTAVELSSLSPVAGEKQYLLLLEENQWRKSFLPNRYQAYFRPKGIENRKFLLKYLLESCFNPVGDLLNTYLMNFTDKRWRKKWEKKNFPMEDYELAFKTTLHHSKNHPANYQKKILQSIE